jgi:hypothetical protein
MMKNDDSYEFGMKKKQYDKETMQELKKDFFVETDAYKKITDKEAKDFLDKHELKVFGNKIPKPSITFESTSFPGKTKINPDTLSLVSCFSVNGYKNK